MFTKYVLPAVALGLLVFAGWHVQGTRHQEPPVPLANEPAHKAFADTVAGSGVVEPQTQNIAVGSPEAGVVVEVNVKVGQRIRAGEALFRLDDAVKRAELKFRTAIAASSEAQLTQLQRRPRPEDLPAAEAQVSEMEANLADRRDQLERAQELNAKHMPKVVTAEEVVNKQQAVRMAEAQLRRVKAQFDLLKAGTWQYDMLVQRAAVEQAEAQVEQTQAELERLVVRALVDGEVLQVNVRPGEFVAAPANQALVVIGDVERLHARVDIDEHDIHRFQPGAKASATLRGLPGQPFALEFVRVEPYVVPKRSLTGDNTERVDTRVLQVIFRIDTRDRALYVGQQLDVFIDAPREGE
ncbi:MAG TPA: efflux RND transporter periplasmic adaptor subunit [Pirellulales bacterium]|nr:efflux RND transporter periplasmic adaptor subunit [Pirellulales bacterium]